MPTRRGSYAAVVPPGAAAPPPSVGPNSVVRAGDLSSAVEGRESFDEDHAVPVKVLNAEFESAAVAPPPPPGAAVMPPPPPRAKPEESLAVFCRLRPLGKGEMGGVVEVTDAKTVRSAPPAQSARHASNHVRREARDYTFTRVFDDAATQADVYEATTAPLVDALFAGRSALLFTYGVTNAGKSYTMMGDPEDEAARGLMPRALNLILEKVEALGGEVKLSFMEIYNENVYDLMDKAAAQTGKRRALRVKDLSTRMEVASLSAVRVATAAHGLALAKAAQAQRKTSSTGLNKTSSRSHSICQLTVVDAAGKAGPVLMLVDLAGSERIDRTGAAASGAQQKEANHINQSIMRLMNCLRVVREKQASGSQGREVVPWRDSKLTHLFQYLLAPPNGGLVARVSMIVNVSPSAGDHNESTYVMSNAAQAKAVAIVRSAADPRAAAARGFATYDKNGRRVVGAAAPAPSEKKRRTDKPAELLRSESQASECSRSQASDVTFDDAGASASADGDALALEVAALKEALALAHERVSVVEREVRDECAEEMGETIARIQQDYAARLARRSSVAGPRPGARGGGGGDDDDAMEGVAEDDDDDDDDAMDEDAPPKAMRDLCKSARKEQRKDELENYVVDLEMQFQETEEELERVRAEKDDECAKLRALLDAERRRAAGGDAIEGYLVDDDAARVPRADHDAALARVEQLERDVAAAREARGALSGELEAAREAAASARDELAAREETEVARLAEVIGERDAAVAGAAQREAEARAACDAAVAAADGRAAAAEGREASMAKQAQVDADAAAAATARAKAAEDRAAAAERALEARADVPIYADVPVPGAREATAALDALRAQAAPRSPARAAPKSPAKSHKKGQSPRVHRRPVVCFFPRNPRRAAGGRRSRRTRRSSARSRPSRRRRSAPSRPSPRPSTRARARSRTSASPGPRRSARASRRRTRPSRSARAATRSSEARH